MRIAGFITVTNARSVGAPAITGTAVLFAAAPTSRVWVLNTAGMLSWLMGNVMICEKGEVMLMDEITIPGEVKVESKTLKETVDKLNATLERLEGGGKKKKLGVKKPFKVPFGLRMGAPGKIKKNYALMLRIKTNGTLKPEWTQIVDEMVYVKENNTYHLASANYVLKWGKFPVIILADWSLRPFNPVENYTDTVKSNELSAPQKVVIEAVKRAQLEMKVKKGFDAKWLIWIAIGAIILFVVITQLRGGTGGFKLF